MMGNTRRLKGARHAGEVRHRLDARSFVAMFLALVLIAGQTPITSSNVAFGQDGEPQTELTAVEADTNAGEGAGQAADEGADNGVGNGDHAEQTPAEASSNGVTSDEPPISPELAEVQDPASVEGDAQQLVSTLGRSARAKSNIAAASSTTSAPYRIEWVGDEDADTRPTQMVVKLQASKDGASYTDTIYAQTVRPNVDGTWSGAFSAIDGGVSYRVVVDSLKAVYETTYDYVTENGVTTTVITNTLRPYGVLNVKLSVSGETAKAHALNPEFTLKLNAKGTLEYEKLSSSGTSLGVYTAQNGKFSLQNGQVAVFRQLTNGTTCSLSAVAPAGYADTPAQNGTISRDSELTQTVKLVYDPYLSDVALGSAVVSLENRPLQVGQFQFTLYDVTNCEWDNAHNRLAEGTLPQDGVPTRRAVNGAANAEDNSGAVRINDLNFAAADEDKEYRYALVQDDLKVKAYTYDDAVYYFIVTVPADTAGDGSVVPHGVWYGPGETENDPYAKLGEDEKPSFTNSFDGKGSYLAQAKLDYVNGVLEADQFTFAVYPLGKGEAPESISAASLTDSVSTGKNNEHGEITFENLEFGMSDVDATTYFLVTQAVPTERDAAITYDRAGYLLAVQVSAEGADAISLGVHATWKKCTWNETESGWQPTNDEVEEDAVTFSNELACGSLSITKLLDEGDDATQTQGVGKTFRFRVRLSGVGAPEDELSLVATPAGSGSLGVSSATAQPASQESGIASVLRTDTALSSSSAVGESDQSDAAGADGSLLDGLASLIVPAKAYAAEPAETARGTVGTNVTWVLYDDKSIVFQPTDEGSNASMNGSIPWSQMKVGNSEIKKESVTGISFKGHIGWGGTSMQAAFGLKYENGDTTNSDYKTMLRYADLSGLDTNGVTSMHSLFNDCKELEEITFGPWFTTKDTTSFYYMFRCCFKLKKLDVSGFDTGKVTDMTQMFRLCGSLDTLNVSNFDTRKVTSTNYMFGDCASLTAIDFGSGFDTPVLKNTAAMFYNCRNLKALDLGDRFDTSNVTALNNMFSQCPALESLNLGGKFTTGSATTLVSAFAYLENVQELDLSGISVSDACDVKNMLYGVKDLRKVKLGPNFKFQGKGDGKAILPSPSGGAYTGSWIRIDESSGNTIGTAMSPAELQLNFNGSLAGTWVWELKETAAVVNFDSNGGTLVEGAPSSAQSTRASSTDAFSAVTLPTAEQVTAPDGYELKGWTIAQNGSSELFTASFTPTANQTYTLYAQYRESKPTKSADGWWDVSVTAGETVTIGDLPQGVSYEVYEQTEAGWTLVSIDGDASATSASGTIAAGADSTVTFTNKYEVGTASVSLRGVVTLDGNEPGETFSFKAEGPGMTGGGTTVVSGSAGTFGFPVKLVWDGFALTVNGEAVSDISAGGSRDLSYTISQTVDTDDAAVTYDAHTWTAKFTVAVPSAAGTPTVSGVSYERDDGETGSQAAFNNVIRTVKLTINLRLTDFTGNAPGDEFPVTVQLSNMRKAGSKGLQSETREFTFVRGSDESFELAVPVGTTYTIVRGTAPGVWSADEGSSFGLLPQGEGLTEDGTAQVGYSYDPTGLSYGNLDLDAYVSLVGDTFKRGDFSFEVVPWDASNGAPAGSAIATAQCKAPDYTGSIGSVGYGAAPVSITVPGTTLAGTNYGLGTHAFALRMTDMTDEGIQYDTHACVVTVTVADAGDGSAAYAVAVDDVQKGFTCRVKPAAISVTKKTQNATTASEDTAFTFRLALSNGEGDPVSPDDGTVSATIDGANAPTPLSFVNGEATFTMKGSAEGTTTVLTGLPAKVHFSLSEGDASGWASVGTPEGAEGDTVAGVTHAATFTNAYATSGMVQIAATVSYDRRLQGNDFSFRLWHADGSGAKYTADADGEKTGSALDVEATEGAIQQVANAADGTVTFLRSFDASDLTDPHYFIIEQVTDDGRDGVSVKYDKYRMLVKVMLADDGQGSLTPTFEYWKMEGSTLTSLGSTPYAFVNEFVFSLPVTGGVGLQLELLVVGLLVAAVGLLSQVVQRRWVRR